MAETRTSPNKKRKLDARNSTDKENYEICGTDLSVEKIRCSNCKRIPHKEIFYCLPEPPITRQHFICDICNNDTNNKCPLETCSNKVVRNTILENLLDDFKFKCPWAEFGCNEENITRDQLTSHQESCEKNPGYLNCSDLFGEECDYRFYTVFGNDEDKVKDMKEHLLTHDEKLTPIEMIFGESTDEHFPAGLVNRRMYVTNVIDWVKIKGNELKPTEMLMGTSLAIWLVETDPKRVETISGYFVSLSEVYPRSHKTKVQLTIKGQTNGFPKLIWNTKNVNTREFQKILSMSQLERHLRNHTIPTLYLRHCFGDPAKWITLTHCPSRVKAE